jgi:predicted CoA-binding protein
MNHDLHVIPINHGYVKGNPGIEGLPTIYNVQELEEPSSTSLSFLTKPTVTGKILSKAFKKGVRHVWLQPGSYDKDSLQIAESLGFETVIAHDRCILKEGEAGLVAAGRAKL